MGKLTQRTCETATSGGKKQKEFFDASHPGLALRVGKEGRKTWTFFFKPPGGAKRARMTLGTYPATTLAEAHQLVLKARREIEHGKDPRYVEQPVANKTIAQLVDDRVRLVLRADANNFLWSCLETERIYDRDVIPVVGTVPVKDFHIRHLNLIIDPIKERGANTQANRTFEHVRALLNFGVERGEIPYSPLAKARPPSEEQVKDRWLDLGEIRHFWNAAPDAMDRSDNVPTILKLILATGGQRPGEVAGMTRQEIDIPNRLWIIPAVRAKNKHEHHVPLNSLAMSLILAAMRRTNGDFLFPNNAADGSTPNYTLAQTLARALAPAEDLPQGRLQMKPFTPHDLRRTVATHMSMEENGLDIPDHHISHLLNHRSVTKNSITRRVYIQHQFIREKRDAADKWGRFLADLVGETVELRVVA